MRCTGETAAVAKKGGDSLKFVRVDRRMQRKIVWDSKSIHLEGLAMKQIALRIYGQVADLVQMGQIAQARELAVSIPIDHLRGLALLLANDSRQMG